MYADGAFHSVDSAEILCVEGQGDYVTLHCVQGKRLVRDSMIHLVEVLPSSNFVRIHRSWIVNLEHVETISSGYVMVSQKRIPVGSTYKSQLLEKVKRHTLGKA